MTRIFENIDCMQGMEKYKDILTSRKVLAIVDPPYGIGAGSVSFKNGTSKNNGMNFKVRDWDTKTPDEHYFDSIYKVSKNQIIWGANYLTPHLRPSMGWILWDKGTGDNSYADGELAFSSFEKAMRIFKYSWVGANAKDSDGRYHPTQKPIKLYKWLLENYAKDHDLILDTHVGSASSLIACEEYGIDYIGFERDKDYYGDAKNRLENARFIRENKKADKCYVNDLALFQG